MADSPPMAMSQRTKEIIQQLLHDGEVSVERLAKKLKTSTSTVRRELGELERSGLLRRTHGGAIRVEPMLYEPFRHLSSFSAQEQLHVALGNTETISTSSAPGASAKRFKWAFRDVAVGRRRIEYFFHS